MARPIITLTLAALLSSHTSKANQQINIKFNDDSVLEHDQAHNIPATQQTDKLDSSETENAQQEKTQSTE
jgi:hypothetical protein